MNLEGARCQGRWELFDSPHPADHKLAQQFCLGDGPGDRCPAILACRELLLSVQSEARVNYGAQGTWAGQLIGRVGVAECGTDSGYFRHRRYREQSCDECKQAHTDAEARRKKERVA